MKKNVLFLLVIVIGCNSKSGQPGKSGEHHKNASFTSADSVAIVAGVKNFFKAFDERDLQKLKDIMSPEMKIIHHNGAITNREEMIAIIKETKNWWPRTRKLSDFECIGDADLAIVGVNNEVIFSLAENKTVMEPYNETWIFKKTGNQWKAVRCHYSKVTVDKHSEEVQ